MSLEIDHSGLGAAYLRSHPDVPISHRDGEPCGWCTRAGVTVGGEGLREALTACAEALHYHPGAGFGPSTCEACAARDQARAALAASPGPAALDVERLARAIDRAERSAGNYRDMKRHRWLAAAIAREYAATGDEP